MNEFIEELQFFLQVDFTGEFDDTTLTAAIEQSNEPVIIMWLQVFLNYLNYPQKTIVRGEWDAVTRELLSRFQIDNDLPTTCQLDRETWQAIAQMIEKEK